MPRTKAVARRTPFLEDDDEGAARRPTKRIKSAPFENNDESLSEIGKEQSQPLEKKVNRLLRAIPKEPKKDAKSTKTRASAKEDKKVERERGVLSALLDAPSDILYEVASYLTPTDLLSISRASHQLRDFFQSKKNRQTWVVSLATTDLPPCPKDLNEPQYASLIFDSDCIACGAPHLKDMYCDLRLRMCGECFRLNAIKSNILVEEFGESWVHNVSEEELDVVYKTVRETTPYFYRKDYYHPARLYYRPDFFDGLRDCVIAYRTKLEEDYKAFVDERLKLIDEYKKDSKQLQTWVFKKDHERRSELNDLLKNHAESVRSRLREIGYTDEDWAFARNEMNSADYYEWTAMTCKYKQLTDEGWKTLLPRLEEFLSRRHLKKKNTEH